GHPEPALRRNRGHWGLSWPAVRGTCSRVDEGHRGRESSAATRRQNTHGRVQDFADRPCQEHLRGCARSIGNCRTRPIGISPDAPHNFWALRPLSNRLTTCWGLPLMARHRADPMFDVRNTEVWGGTELVVSRAMP